MPGSSNDHLSETEQEDTPREITSHSKRKREATPRDEKPSADHYLTHFPKILLTAKYATDAKFHANPAENAASIMLQTT